MSVWLWIVVVIAILYILYVPVPAETWKDRIKLHIFELSARIVYFYPTNALKCFGVHWQVWWARNSISMLTKALQIPLWIRPRNNVTIFETKFNHVPVIVYVPKERRPTKGALVLIHGGGFVLMDAASYGTIARKLAVLTGNIVFNIDYRKAPEHLFPTALDDCEAAIVYLLNDAYQQYDVDPHRVAIIGDSAGGNLAASSTFRLTENKMQNRKAKLQILVYPWLQFIDFRTPSYLEAVVSYRGSSLPDPEILARWASLYIGISTSHSDLILCNDHYRKEVITQRASFLLQDMRYDDLPFNSITDKALAPELSTISLWSQASVKSSGLSEEVIASVRDRLEAVIFNPDLSPMMREDLSSAPKTLMVTCQCDPLRDEGYWYAKRLQKAGVDVKWRHYEKGFHAMLNMHAQLPLAKRMLMDIVDFINENL